MKKNQASPSAPEAAEQIVTDIFRVAGLFRRWGDRIAGEVGQTQARWQVLDATAEGKQRVPQIARRLNGSRQSVQRIADLLAADGLVEYIYNPDHERSPLLRLTEEGAKVLGTLTSAAKDHYAELAEGLRLEEDLVAAQIVLAKFRMHLQRDPAEDGDKFTHREAVEAAATAAMRGHTRKPR